MGYGTSSAAGARGVGRGCPPLQWGLRSGHCSLPRIFFNFRSPNGDWCILVLFFQKFSCVFYTQKLVLLGFQNLPLQFTVVFPADDNSWLSHKSSQHGVVGRLLPVVPSSCKLCMSVVEGSTDTPIAFIIILCMDRHICAIALVVNYCTNSPNLKLRC